MGDTLIPDKKIEELKTLLSSATIGPWVADIQERGSINEYWTGKFLTKSGSWYTRPMDRVVQEPDYVHARNAELVAAAVTSLPSLIKEIERLKIKVFKAETQYEAQLRINREELDKLCKS
jgi:hypothetical protein